MLASLLAPPDFFLKLRCTHPRPLASDGTLQSFKFSSPKLRLKLLPSSSPDRVGWDPATPRLSQRASSILLKAVLSCLLLLVLLRLRLALLVLVGPTPTKPCQLLVFLLKLPSNSLAFSTPSSVGWSRPLCLFFPFVLSMCLLYSPHYPLARCVAICHGSVVLSEPSRARCMDSPQDTHSTATART